MFRKKWVWLQSMTGKITLKRIVKSDLRVLSLIRKSETEKNVALVLQELLWRLIWRTYVVMWNSQVVQQFPLSQMPHQQRERFLCFISTYQYSGSRSLVKNDSNWKFKCLANLPSPETNNEFKKRSSPALKVVTQSPDSRFIRLTYILLRDRQTKCWGSWSPKYGIFWFMTPFRVTWNDQKAMVVN